ncbi:MAG: endonuclease [Clostridiales bacterium]|nr:endonuclease [Clostridiales bacterium]
MKKFFNMIAVYLAAVFLFCSVVGCAADRVPTLPKIATPEVTIGSDGLATWNSVENALYYVYVIDEGDEKLTAECQVQLAPYESVKVKAVSGSEKHSDSVFSKYETYIQSTDQPTQPTKLGTPQVTVNANGVATWGAIGNAQYYVYVISGGTETNTTERSIQLADNQTIKVKACSDDEDYSDSDYSQLITYTHGTIKTTLNTPQVSINADGVATWNSVSNAEYYVYVIDNGSETTTTLRSVTLANGQTVSVKACNDGENYVNSEYSQPKTYTKVIPQPTKLGTPQVSISANGLATWGSITNAQYYYYVISGGEETKTTDRSVQLSENQTIKVKAGSDDEDYADSDYSQIKTYVKSVLPDLSAEVQAYYSVITATSGNSLLGQVHDLITKTHATYTSYNDCKNPELIMKTDGGTASKTVMDFYTQENMSSTWGSGKTGTWNREHVWCQNLSNGLWGESGGGSDMHHIRPTETALNGTRSNHKYGIANGGSVAYFKDTDGSNKYVGGWVNVSAKTFEPLDKVKGDVARIVMYVYTHYNTYANVYGTTNGSGGKFGTLKFTNVMSASSESAAIQLLLEWNAADPVDEIEIARNDAVYKIQGNRNPFIDHPEYANAIWG